MTYKLPRNRSLSISSAGTPNELLCISEHDCKNYKTITDLIVLSNYDYDGLLSEIKLKSLIDWFNI